MSKQTGKWYHLVYPMLTALVTSAHEGKQNVLTANWVMPCSFEPPLLAVSIGKTRFSHGLIKKSGEFCVCVPPADKEKEAWFVGTKHGDKTDKFKESGFSPAPAKKVKAPLIKECVACLECKVVSEHEAGDHTIFVGEVLEVHEQKNGKKLFYRGDGEFFGV